MFDNNSIRLANDTFGVRNQRDVELSQASVLRGLLAELLMNPFGVY